MAALEKDWYDKTYSDSIEAGSAYAKDPAKAMYAPLWRRAIGMIGTGARVFDLGCGPGQFEQLAVRFGVKIVRAVDFSKVAIERAKLNNKKIAHVFKLADLRQGNIYNFRNYDVAVCFEVLEHIEDDLFVLGSIPIGKRIIFSVPNYPYQSHVRFFKLISHVKQRYGKYVNIGKISRVVMDREHNKVIWLCSGIRRM